MLVCNVSLRPPRTAIAASLAEGAAASDATATGNVVFATLVDDPASVGDIVNAYLGEIMLEAASAAATVNAGLALTSMVVEAATAVDVTSSSMPVAATVTEAATANDAPTATVTSPSTVTWESASTASVTLSSGDLVATNTGTTSANQGAKVATASGKTSGKYYFEVTWTSSLGGNNRSVGVGTTASTYTNMGSSATTGTVTYSGGTIWSAGSSVGGVGITWITGRITGVAVDLDNRRIWFRQSPSGIWNNNAANNPATNTGGLTIPAGTMVPFLTFGGASGVANNVMTANFGASSFSGVAPSGFTSGWPI